MRTFFASLLILGLISGLNAQNIPNYWKPVALDKVLLPESATRQFEPIHYTAYRLDYAAVLATLAKAPLEFTAESQTKKCFLKVPQANGSFEDFAIVEVKTMEPGLAARYPNIRTYAGASAQSPGKRIRITCSPDRGFEGFIRRADKGVEFVELLAKGQQEYYMAYDNKDFPLDLSPHAPNAVLGANGDVPETAVPPVVDRGGLSPVTLHVYRFACSATGEFSVDNGGTTASVLAKITSTTNNLNAIYEADLDIRLILIDEEDKIIFLDPATDPFSGISVHDWVDQNTVIVNNALAPNGTGKYDLGHVFGRYMEPGGASGVAFLNTCCLQVSKAKGCSAGNIPYGSNFFSTVGQEIGHQWNARHTWNHCGTTMDSGGDGERCEPGSGTTIMSYSGGCSGGDNVMGGNSADLYYQACSIFAIRNFVDNGFGATCGTELPTDNNAPMVTIPYPDNFFIPIGTPFELNASGTDPDGDALTYNWDEIDLGPGTPLGQPVANSPLFRSYPPTDKTNRVFPRIQTIVSNNSSNAELLPTYTRDLTFCFIARDNQVGGGGIAFDTIAFNATALAGPFLVLSPNSSGTVWNVGEYHTVTWDVANTDKSPVNCHTVNIRLSIDGGLTYPITLASGVPNNGKYCIQVPDNVVNNARIRVEAADNVFFDISNTNIKIQQPAQAGFTLCTPTLKDNACLPGTFTAVVSTGALLGFNSPITLSSSGLPSGATATFSPNPVQPGNDATLTITFANGTPESVFDLTVTGDANGSTASYALTLNVVGNDFSAFALETPANGATGVGLAPTFYWNTVTDGDTYEIQLATSPSFGPGTIVLAKQNMTTDSLKTPFALIDGETYYWHVRPKNECNNAEWSEPFVFITALQSCAILTPSDLPKNISANSTPTIESKITVSSGGILSDVNVKSVAGDHTFFKDLEAHLISPAGTDVLLWKDKCPGTYTFNIRFDDAVAAAFNCPPPSNGAGSKPAAPLSAMNGQDAAGVWTLRVKDNTIGSGGHLTGFELELCSNTALNAPFIVNNNVLQLAPGGNATVSTSLLKTDDANNIAAQLKYTIITIPQNGVLLYNGTTVQPGDQFTQSAIDDGVVIYFDYGLNLGSDDFRFAVTDGEGGMVTGTFVIQPFATGTKDLVRNLSFSLAPNPADETIYLSFPEKLASDTRIVLYNAAGQQLRSWAAASGTGTMTLQIGDLPDGLYAVSVQNETSRGVKKVVIR